MNKDVKKTIIIKIIQLAIYGISITGAILGRWVSPNWPAYLLIVGILTGFFIPMEFRSNFFSTSPGIILKNHTRRLENIIDLTFTFIVIILFTFINIFFN